MSTKKYTVPNWAQSLMASAAGLDPDNVAVRFEDDTKIDFVQYMPRREFLVCKATGDVIEH